jgi:L-amino acid N-acyltransferase YncA
MHCDFLRQGYTTEMAAALAKTAFLVEGAERVEAHCDARNQASAAVVARLGFEKTGHVNAREKEIWSMSMVQWRGSSVATLEVEAFDAAERRIPLPERISPPSALQSCVG